MFEQNGKPWITHVWEMTCVTRISHVLSRFYLSFSKSNKLEKEFITEIVTEWANVLLLSITSQGQDTIIETFFYILHAEKGGH